MIHKVHFGKRIASYRKQQAWSQAELAEKLGVTSQAVSKWETGAALPDIDLLLELSHLYGVSINELLEDRDILKTLAVQGYKDKALQCSTPPRRSTRSGPGIWREKVG